ncbi:Fur family transcriptional regulator [Saccharomonospora sp. NPDC046836]|uniref:Fur family transcriptional regulator n=1 Tax=Saccharomonospora sp. NPDC046836 TaxID=3156921 RepID=UPI003402170D
MTVPDGQAAAEAAVVLRSAGLRVTGPRRSVLVWLARHPHSTAEAVRTGVCAELGSVSHQAVYDVLAACVAAGLVRSIQPAGHPARFERRVADNHHHLVCRGCGRTEDVDCLAGSAPCLAPGEDHRFAVDEAEIIFWGRCPACSAAFPAPRTGTERES